MEAVWRIHASVNYTIIGSDNGLSPGWRQAIIWTNWGILLIGPIYALANTIIGLDNGLSPGGYQAIIWTNWGILLIGPIYALANTIIGWDNGLSPGGCQAIIWTNCGILSWPQCVNTLRPRRNGRRFPDDTFKCIFLNENARISIKISLKFVPKGPINNMAWRRSGDKPLSEPMMVSLLTHICVTRPQWVNVSRHA